MSAAELWAPAGLVVFFDDERSFKPGFRDDAVVIRSLAQAEPYFAEIRESGQRIAELWLDFVLNPGSVDQALYDFPGELVDRVIYHSSSGGGQRLVAVLLREAGFTGEVEPLWQAFPNQSLFV